MTRTALALSVLALASLAVAQYPSKAQLDAALKDAGPNATELKAALAGVPKAQRTAMEFLIANMPKRDLTTLKAAFLIENVTLAFKARDEAPWGKSIPEEVFLDDVLPYANVNESRDPWRADFHQRFADLVKGCKTPGEAAQKLNATIFTELNVQYHATKRKKPDQSPAESMAIHYASCTGLSIILADACRAVGVPARVAGIPQWTTQEGNHTWTEVWDGDWRYVGSAEPGPFDQTWFTEIAAKANPEKPMNRIYAAGFKKRSTSFICSWAPDADYVPGYDMTSWYVNRCTVRVSVLDHQGMPVKARVRLWLDDWVAADKEVAGPTPFVLGGRQRYAVEITVGTRRLVGKMLKVSDAKDQTVALPAP